VASRLSTGLTEWLGMSDEEKRTIPIRLRARRFERRVLELERRVSELEATINRTSETAA
jgi:predicted Fe-S protein YdhL (DUF1289 family)